MQSIQNQRNKYDSFLVWLYCNDKDHLVPEKLRKNIPYSTAATWRNLDYSSYIGSEVRNIQKNALEQYELLEKYNSLKKTVKILTKVWVNISKVVLPVLQQKKQYEEVFVNEIQRLFTAFPKKFVLKLAGVSASSFYERLVRLKLKCGISPAQICLKRHPLQLAVSEIEKIKTLFTNPDFKSWPARSLYYEGKRNCKLHISLSTFYKYVGLLGLKRKRHKRPSKTEGLKAKNPNEFWHADTTFYELENGQKAAIAFVTDNFSKAILGSAISIGNSAVNVEKALRKAMLTVQKYHPEHLKTILVTDGGSENHAKNIDLFLKNNTPPAITKVIALKGIRYSNSPVEAVNKIIKQYLRQFKPKTFTELQATVAFAEQDYTYQRPHGSLKGLIPIEAYTNPDKKLDFEKEMKQAKALRIAENRKVNCAVCNQPVE